MRALNPSSYRRPYLYAIGWGVNIASLLHLLALLASGELSRLPTVVKAAPVVGMVLATVLYCLGGYTEARREGGI